MIDRTKVRREECRDAGCPLAEGGYHCSEHEARGAAIKALEEEELPRRVTKLEVHVGIGKWGVATFVGGMLAISLSIFGVWRTVQSGNQAALEKLSDNNEAQMGKLGQIAEAVQRVTGRQEGVLSEQAHIRQRLDEVERRVMRRDDPRGEPSR